MNMNTTCTACQNIQRTLGQSVQCNRCRKAAPNAMTRGTLEVTALMRAGMDYRAAEAATFGAKR